MGIQRIESLVFGAADMEEGVRYFDDWGLEAVERGGRGVTYRLPENQTVIVRAADDPGLPSAPDGTATLRETIWGVDTKEELAALGAELARDRDVTEDADGTLHARDESGFAFALRVWDRTPADVDAPRFNMNAFNPRLDEPVDRTRRVRPIRLGHVVFHIPTGGAEKAWGFYLDRLKFKLSERAEDTGAFMRCQGSQDHHNLFLAHRMNRALFNHVAFEVRDFDEIMLGGQYMKSRGWEPATTPGRHIMGSNMYWYFKTPFSGRTEYYADMDRLSDDWKPPVWEKNPGYAMWTVE
jgi:catechol-2,3-dioxygenase